MYFANRELLFYLVKLAEDSINIIPAKDNQDNAA